MLDLASRKYGFESRFYGEKKKIPVIELIISGYAGKVKTIIKTF